MINLDSIAKGNNKEHNKKWPFVPNHPYKILIIGGSGSGKTRKLKIMSIEIEDNVSLAVIIG